MTRAEFTKRTKLEAFERANGRCQCGARLSTGNVEYHHETECTYGGTAAVDNCVALCRTCHRTITSKQAAVIAKSNRIRAKHLGLQGKRQGGFRGWRRFSGEAVFASDGDHD